jgi:beta-xylosidase
MACLCVSNSIFSDNWSDPIHFDTLGYDNDIFVDDDGTAYVTECGISDNVNKIYGICGLLLPSFLH